ncbi:MAG: cupin domain-containing protein [Firmicutes bacterium]|nr:cupin domain-containing protein [Bacillota bacterium]
MSKTYEAFQNGWLRLPGQEIRFAGIPWSKHAKFEGVALKHLVTAKETDGQFSYHLVRVAPGKAIGAHTHPAQLETHEVIGGTGRCINNGSVLPYEPGVVSIFPMGLEHSVQADEEGLLLFAKFMPALC